MISSISGKVIEVEEESLVIEIGGLGFEVFAPAAVCLETGTGKQIRLFTYLVVRETELSQLPWP